MINVYFGDDLHSLEIKRIYEELFEDMRGGVWISEDKGVLEVLLYEDFRIPNNPFSDITNFPLNVTFSFEKLIQEEDFMYNLWEIRFPINLIEKITEEYEEDLPQHVYTFIFKNGNQIKIIGESCWYSQDGSSCMFNSDIGDLIHNQCDIYHKVQISCEITKKEIMVNYFQKRIESQNNYLEQSTNLLLKERTRQQIVKLQKKIDELGC